MEANFFSILADEVTSYNTEIVVLCVRFVDKEFNIRKEFLHFSKVHRTTGAVVSKEILQVFNNLNLPVENARGQGYDGAPNMSSDTVGVQGRIIQISPLSIYIHCIGHCLNLIIAIVLYAV